MSAIAPEPVTTATTLTNSSINTFMECPRKYDLMYRQNLRPEREADYFRIGGAYHLAHEVFGKTGRADEAVLAIYQNYETPPEYVADSEELLEKWYYEATTCVCLFRGWLEYYGHQSYETLQTEQVFRVPILSPDTGKPTPRFKRDGKIDKIVRLTDGRTAVLEYKTSSEDITPGADYWWKLKIDSQISGYYVAALALGVRIDTVLYDVTRKPTIRPERVALTDEDGVKIVLDSVGERVRTQDGKRWRQTGDTAQGYVLQTRKMDLAEWEAKLMNDIRNRPEWYYVRDELVRLDNDLEEYSVDLWNQQKAIAAAETYGRFYRNTRACTGRNKRCTMFDICCGRVSFGPDGVPAGFRRAAVSHEELEG